MTQRFGEDSKIYGMDIWESGLKKCQEKIRVLDLKNVTIFEQDASTIPLENNSIDLITSNLGINNFEQKEVVLAECLRVLKKEGHLSIATNTMETFKELFDIFSAVIKEEKIDIDPNLFTKNRGTKESIIDEIEAIGFTCSKIVSSQTNMRFTNAMAVLDHRLIRIGFMASWEGIIPEKKQKIFFEKVLFKIDDVIQKEGEFRMGIPVLYLEFYP
jgi:arsenite methyltransferase